MDNGVTWSWENIHSIKCYVKCKPVVLTPGHPDGCQRPNVRTCTVSRLCFACPRCAHAVRTLPVPSDRTRGTVLSAASQHLHQAAMAGESYCNMCKTQSNFTTYRWNTCNIRSKYLKHLQHMLKTLAKHKKKTWKHVYTHCKHQDKTLKSTWNTWIYMQHPDLVLQHPNETIATYVWNRWNISNVTWNIRV